MTVRKKKSFKKLRLFSTFMLAKSNKNTCKNEIFMNLWCLNYELFLMGNNKTLMKSITVSPFMFCLFLLSLSLSHSFSSISHSLTPVWLVFCFRGGKRRLWEFIDFKLIEIRSSSESFKAFLSCKLRDVITIEIGN